MEKGWRDTPNLDAHWGLAFVLDLFWRMRCSARDFLDQRVVSGMEELSPGKHPPLMRACDLTIMVCFPGWNENTRVDFSRLGLKGEIMQKEMIPTSYFDTLLIKIVV